MREYLVEVHWADTGWVMGSPAGLMKAMGKPQEDIDTAEEAMSKAFGKREIYVESETQAEALYKAAKIIEEEGHLVSGAVFVP